MVNYDITGDAELKDRVRHLTGYEDNQDELPEKQLDGILSAVKLNLKNAYGSTSWYSDEGYSAALLGSTCIYAKSQVENYSVSQWSIGDESITVKDASPDDNLQISLWNDIVNNGLDNSEVIQPSSGKSIKNTSDYIG